MSARLSTGTGMRARRPVGMRLVRVLGALFLACLLQPGTVAACTLDNTASLSANGVRAGLATDTPVSGATWAPFTVDKAFATGSLVRLDEARADLARSLSPATLARPFRWSFGDGSALVRMTATHRYMHPGTFRLQVFAYSPLRRRWLQFDAVRIHIVPPGQLTQANLGYYALRALDLVVSSSMDLITAALGLLLLYTLVSHMKAHRGRPSGADVPPWFDETVPPL